jgi:hypothetical protein
MTDRGTCWYGVWLAALTLVVCGPVAEAQLYDPDRLPRGRPFVWINERATGAIPQVLIEGDWVLSLWDQNMVATPGLALSRLSTGETLWTITVEPGRPLKACLLDDVVIVGRSDDRGQIREYQWLDPETGAVRNAQPLTENDAYHGTLATQNLLLTAWEEVFDVRTGDRLGQLPDEFDDAFLEGEGRLFGVWRPDRQSIPSLAVADLSDLAAARPWNPVSLFPEDVSVAYLTPSVISGSRLAFVVSAFGAPSGQEPDPRKIFVIDFEQEKLVWQTEVHPRAPLRFVTDREADSPNPPLSDGWSAPPCLLIDWSTGEQRPSHPDMHPADLAVWAGALPQYVRTRRVGELTLLHVVTKELEHLLALDDARQIVWRRVLEPLRATQYFGGPDSPFAFSGASDFALALGGSSFEIFDLRTGRTVKEVRPRDVGLTQLGPGLAPDSADGSTPAAAGGQPPDNTQEVSVVSPWLLGALGLLVGMLVLRFCARSSKARPSPFSPSSASRES